MRMSCFRMFLSTAAILLAGLAASAPAAAPHVVFLIGEDGYRTGETLPAFIAKELDPLGFRTTVVRSDPKDPDHFPGIEAIRDAGLLVLSVRRRTPPEAELALIRR